MGNNVRKRFTVSLDIETKDLEKQVKSTVGNLKTILADLGNASDKMGYFKELVDYIGQIDAAMTALRSKNKDAFNHMFDGLDTSLKQQLEGLFGASGADLGKLDVLREKLATLTPNSGIKELRNFANEISELFSAIGAKSPFEDIESQFSGKATAKHIEILTNALNGFATVWDGINKKVQHGFGLGGNGSVAGAGSGAIANLSAGVQKQIDELNKQVNELEEVKTRFEKVAEMVKKVQKKGDKAIPDSYKSDLTVESVQKLMDEFDALKIQLESGDKASVDYYNNLTRMTEVVLTLKRALSDVRADDSIKQIFAGAPGGRYGNMIGKLSGYANSALTTGIFGQVTDLSGSKSIDGMIDGYLSKINSLKTGNSGVQKSNNKTGMSYQDLKNKIKEYYDLVLQYQDESLDDDAIDKIADDMEKLETVISKLGKEKGKVDDILEALARLSTENATFDGTVNAISKMLGIEDTSVLIEQAKAKMQEFFSYAQKFQSIESLEGINLDKTVVELESARDELKKLYDQGALTEQQMNEVAAAFNTARTNLGALQSKSVTPGVSTIGGTGTRVGSVTGTGTGNAITDVDFSSLENTIKSEIASLANKLDNVLKVEIVKNNADDIQNTVEGIKSSIDKISSHIDAYYASQGMAKNQAEINAMKGNLTQLFKFVSDFNARKTPTNEYQHQELGAAILSDGSISVGYGEDGTVPWDRMASTLVANLSKSLLVDIHSHPWEEFWLNGKKYANDSFSGANGDIGAFRTSKDLGAQIAAMITGNIIRTLDLSKLSDSQMDQLRSKLVEVEKSYASDPKYSKYIAYNGSSIAYREQDTLEGQHKVTDILESMMYKAFEGIGYSKDKVDQEIFKKYNLTDDAQLTELAERLVVLSQSSNQALSPVERLAEIISLFSGDVTSANAKVNLEAYKKGELTAAQVFNNLNGEGRVINQDTMDSLLQIDTAGEMSAVESLLTQITSVLDAISTSVSNIDSSTRQSTINKIDTAINDVVDISNGKIMPYLTSNIKSIFDPLNISEYKNQEVISQADTSIEQFQDSINSLFRDASKGKLNIEELNSVLNKFYTALSHVQDATKQIELYENRTREEVEYNYNGEIASGYLEDKQKELIQFDELQKLLYLLSQAKIDINKTKDFYKDGFYSGSPNGGDSDSLVGHLQSISATLDSIYGVLHGFTGIESTSKNSVAYKQPTVETNIAPKEFSEQDLSVLNSILQEIQNIGNYLQAHEQVNISESDAQDLDAVADLVSFIKSKMSQQLASEDTLQLLKSIVDNLYNKELQDSVPVVDTGDNEADKQEPDVYQLLTSKLQQIVASEDTLQALKSVVDAISKSLSKQAKWALESTLQKTNSILSSNSTESGSSGKDPDVDSGDQPSDNNHGGAGKREEEVTVDDDAENAARKLEKTKAQLSGMLNSIRSEFKSTKIDMNLDGITQPQQDIVDGYLDIVAVLKQLQKTSGSVTNDQIQSAQQLYNVLLQQIKAYKTQNNIGASKVKKSTQYGTSVMQSRTAQHNTLTTKVSQDSLLSNSSVLSGKMAEYENAWTRLAAIYSKMQNGPSPTEDDKIAFKEASAECNNLGKEVEKLLKTYDKMHNDSNVAGSIELGDYANRKQELLDYVESTYGAKAAIGDFKNNFNELEFTIKNSDGTFTKAKVSIDNLRTSIIETQGDTQKATSKFSEFFGAIGKKMNELWVYAWSRLGIDELFQQVRKGIQYVREIDVALTELKKVTNETDATYDQFLQTMSKTASAVGSTVKDLTSSAADWARLGYSIQEAGELAATTAKLLNVSEFSSVDEATSALVSSLQAFTTEGQDVGQRAEEIVDVLNHIGNRYPVATNELAEGLATSSAALVAANNSIEAQVALLAAGNATMQDVSTVASGLKIVAARLRGTTTDIDDDAESAVTNVSKLQAKIKALTASANGGEGIDILNEQGEYKSTYEILSEISKIFDKMDDVSSAALLELIAGKNRSSVVAAILQNGDILEEAYADAFNSAGSAQRELDTYLESIQGRIDLFNNSVQTMWMNFLDTDVVKFLVDVGTWLVKLIDNVGLLNTLAITFGARFLNKNFGNMLFGDVKSAKENIKELKNALEEARTIYQNNPTQENKDAYDKAQKNLETYKAEFDTDDASVSANELKTDLDEVKNSAQDISNTGEEVFEQLSFDLDNTSQSGQELKTHIDGVDQSTETLGNTSIETGTKMQQSFDKTKTKAAALGKQVLQFAKSMAVMYAISAAFEVVAANIEWVSNRIKDSSNSWENLNEKYQDASGELENCESELRNLEAELDTTNEQIDDLLSQGALSFVEQEELERLQAVSAELERQLDITQTLQGSLRTGASSAAIGAGQAYLGTSFSSEQSKSERQEEAAEHGEKIGKAAGLAIGAGATAIGAKIGGGIGSVGGPIGIAIGAGVGSIVGGLIGSFAGSASEGAEYDSEQTVWQVIESMKGERAKLVKARDDAYAAYAETGADEDKDAWQNAASALSSYDQSMAEHMSQLSQYYNTLKENWDMLSESEKAQAKEWGDILDKYNITMGGKDAKANAINRIFGNEADDKLQSVKKALEDMAASGEKIDLKKAFGGDIAEYDAFIKRMYEMGIYVYECEDAFKAMYEAEVEAASVDFSDIVNDVLGVTSAISGVKDAWDEFLQNGFISTDTASSLLEFFDTDNLKDQYNEYLGVMMSGDASIEKAREATEKLAYEYMQDKINLGLLSEDQKQLYVDLFRRLGIANAEDFVKKVIQQTGIDKIEEKFDQYLEEYSMYKSSPAALKGLISNKSDIEDIIEQYGLEEDAIDRLIEKLIEKNELEANRDLIKDRNNEYNKFLYGDEDADKMGYKQIQSSIEATQSYINRIHRNLGKYSDSVYDVVDWAYNAGYDMFQGIVGKEVVSISKEDYYDLQNLKTYQEDLNALLVEYQSIIKEGKEKGYLNEDGTLKAEVEEGYAKELSEVEAALEAINAEIDAEFTVDYELEFTAKVDDNTISGLTSALEEYQAAMRATEEVVIDGQVVSEEYKQSLIDLGVSAVELAKCFDENNPLIVKNAKRLKELVRATKNSVLQNSRLARSQAMLQYYQLYKKMQGYISATGKIVEGKYDEISALYNEMGALSKAISKYAMLETQLLGTTDAYEKFQEAQTTDSETNYIGQTEEMILALGQAFNTAELGTESVQAAIAGLVPESVYKDLDSVDDKMAAIYKYFKEGKLSQYFDITFDDDGNIENAEMKLGNLRKFIEDGLANGVFVGDDWQHFDLSEDIYSLEQFAEQMGVTTDVAFAFFKTLEDHDIEWLNGDYSTLFEQLTPTTQKIQQLAEDMQKEFDQTPIDLTARVKVDSQTMKEAGWDIGDGEYATVNTVSAYASEFGLTDENGNDYAINLTPILPDGTVISGGEQGLKDWIRDQIDGGADISELDVFLGSYKTMSEAEAAAEKLHEMQEAYYDAVENHSFEYDIYNTTQKIAELNAKLASGKIDAEEYKEQFAILNQQLNDVKDASRANMFGKDGVHDKTADEIDSMDTSDVDGYFEAEQKVVEATNGLDEATKKYEEALKAVAEATKDGREATEEEKKALEDAEKVVDDATEAYAEAVKKRNEFAKPTTAEVGIVLTDIESEIAAAGDKFNDALSKNFELDENGYYVIKAGLDITSLEEQYPGIEKHVNLLNSQTLLKAYSDTGEAEADLNTINDTLTNIQKILEKVFKVEVDADGAVNKVNAFKDVWDGIKSKTVSLWTKIFGGGEGNNNNEGKDGSHGVNGTAHARGTTHTSGNWGLPQSEHDSLVGELGPEIVVDPNSGRYYTVGDNGAEMVDLPKGAIIFNHKQTEGLLKNGYVTSRGKAYASGNAHLTIFDEGSSQSQWTGTGYDSGSDPTWDAADALESAADSISDSADEFKEVFDWIEVRLEEINDKIGIESARLENKVGHKAQNKTVDKIIDLNHKLYDNLIAGSNKYYAYANKLLSKVPSEYREAAKDGTIAIETFVGEADEKTLEAIQEYREWVQKGDEAAQQAQETLTEISNLAKQAIDNIAQDYDNKRSLKDNKINQYEAYNAFLETDQGFESASIYQAMIKENNKIISGLEQQRDKMQAELNKRVESGEIKKYSQDWYDAVNDIAAVDTEIIELKTDTENYQDAINELHWEHFDALMGQYESISEEAENLIDILGNKDLFDESGSWTDEGIASLGLYAQQMENAEAQAKQYEEEIKYLNKNWQKLGYTEQEYLEKLDELKDGQYDAVKAYNDTKDSIVDLNKERIDAIKEGIDKEIEAYEELIDKKKEELDAEKDLHDFQKSVMDQQKDIADIQRQLAALSGDNSASARAKRAQLEAELAETQAELDETYYDRSVSNKQEALDKELESFKEEKDKEKEALDEYLEDTEQVVSDSMGVVQANVDGISNTIGKTAKEYGLTINDALTKPWKDGTGAVSEYTEKFGDSVSATSEALKELELENLANQLEIENDGSDAKKAVEENIARYQEAKYQEPKQEPEGPKDDEPEQEKTIKVGGKINAGSAKIYDYVGAPAENQYYSKDPVYVVLAESGDWIQVRHHKEKSGVTGWFKKGAVTALASGTSNLKKSGIVNVDELGEELILRAKNGRLTYMEKGTGVVPADLTSNLMEWGKLDPSTMLDQNRPSVGVHPEINHTEVQIDNSIGELIHIDNCSTETLPDVKKIVNEALEKHTQRLNQSLRKYTR